LFLTLRPTLFMDHANLLSMLTMKIKVLRVEFDLEHHVIKVLEQIDAYRVFFFF
jgi:hypothetical protein